MGLRPRLARARADGQRGGEIGWRPSRLERRTEPAYTAVLSAYMQRFVALRGLTNVTVVHQAPDGRDGKIDIAV